MEDKKSEENKDQVKVEYTISNKNIKFATFCDEELDTYFQKEGMTKEILIDNLSKLIEALKPIVDILIDITKKDTNTFNTLCLKYNINSYDFIVNYKLTIELASLISSKVQNNTIQNTQLTLEDFFPQESNDNNKDVMDIIQIQYKTNDKDFSKIKSKISELLEKIKIINETKEECGIPFMCYLTKVFVKYMNKVKTQLDSFTSIENYQNKDIKIYRKNMIIFFDLIFLLQNLEIGYSILYRGYLYDKNDIFNFEENSKEWEDLRKIIFRVNSSDLNKVREDYKKENDRMANSSIYINKMDKNSNLFFNITKIAGSAIKYKINDENLKIFETKENKLTSNKIFMEEGLKMFKNKMIKNLFMRRFPKIVMREKIYMKREHPEISLEYIKSLLMKIYDKDIILKNFEDTHQPERAILDEKIKNEIPIWTSQKLKKEEKKYYVSTWLFSNRELNLNKKIPEPKNNFNLFGLFSKKKDVTKEENKDAIKPKSLLIHIHGGGFLESNTFIAEKWLREASIECDIPIIGINYGCAPKHKYPEALNDCFQAYMWILDHCEQELGFKPEKILLSGDSAGGSLMLALTLLIIAMNEFDEKKIKIPDLLLGLYPACSLDSNSITLSGCINIENILLSPKDGSYIWEAYRGYYKNELDPFINQNKADERLLNHFPVTRFLTGSCDGLRDEALRFIYKLSKIKGVDVKLYDFTYYEHGFMGNDNRFLSDIPHSIYFKEIKEMIKK